jgi:AbrB family looped-hinge helix DNA binding protein
MDATLNSTGQITLPKAVRERLHLGAGDRVTFVIEGDGAVRLVPKRGSVRTLKGVLPRPAVPVSLDDMERAIHQGAAGKA